MKREQEVQSMMADSTSFSLGKSALPEFVTQQTSFPVQSSTGEDDFRCKRFKVAKVNGFIVYTRLKKNSSGSNGASDDDFLDSYIHNEVRVKDEDEEPLINLKNALKHKSEVLMTKGKVEDVEYRESSCNAEGSWSAGSDCGDEINWKRKRIMRLRGNDDETVTVPVEIIVNGLEAMESGAVSKVDVEMIDEGSAVPVTPPKKNLELKMSKKISLASVPMTVKELFETGLLEGVPVVYMGGKKFQGFGLRGTIKDAGILCSCSLCKGCRVIPPSQFEIHAINQYRRAGQYICFENGKSLLDVLNACRTCRLESLEATIEKAISGSPVEKNFTCRRCKGTFPINFVGKIGPVCTACLESKESDEDPCTASGIGISSMEPFTITESSKTALVSALCQDISQSFTFQRTGRKPLKQNLSKSTISRKSSRRKLLWTRKPKSIKLGMLDRLSDSIPVLQTSWSKKQPKIVSRVSKSVSLSKSSSGLLASISSSNRYQWKITKKDQRLHKFVFEEGGLPDGSELAYYARGQRLLVGYKRGFGILCSCCNSEVSPSTFEAHAGWATRKKPYAYIYTSNGVSLHELAISLSKGRKYSAKDNDDLCIVCSDGGSLLLCDGCPRAFHKECAAIPSIPRGRWYCQYCENMFQREKFVEHNANAIAAGRVEGVDPIEEITSRCIRMVTNIDSELSACALCRGYDFSRSGFGPRTIILCDQCEKEFHVGCLRTHKIANLKELPKGKWFCCTDCNRVHSSLQKMLARGAVQLPDSLLTALKLKHEAKGLQVNGDLDVRWRLLSGKSSCPETKLLLSQALTIFQDCFDPIVDTASGRDLIPLMVYGKNSKGQDYGGMYCSILLVNSFIVSAGILRIFGSEVAELPLVATSNSNHGKGYFQLLFSCIEKFLALLNVQSLLLPAAEMAETIWTDKFGFERLSPEQLNKYRKSCCQMVSFKGTSMLVKDVPVSQTMDASLEFLDYC